MITAGIDAGSRAIKVVLFDDANMEIRKDLGLEELPPTTHSNKKALDQVQEIMKRTGFKDLIEGEGEEGN